VTDRHPADTFNRKSVTAFSMGTPHISTSQTHVKESTEHCQTTTTFTEHSLPLWPENFRIQ